MRPATKHLLAQLREEDVLEEMQRLLTRRYADEWGNSAPRETDYRERLYIKVQLLEDFFIELFSILDENQEIDK